VPASVQAHHRPLQGLLGARLRLGRLQGIDDAPVSAPKAVGKKKANFLLQPLPAPQRTCPTWLPLPRMHHATDKVDSKKNGATAAAVSFTASGPRWPLSPCGPGLATPTLLERCCTCALLFSGVRSIVTFVHTHDPILGSARRRCVSNDTYNDGGSAGARRFAPLRRWHRPC
jgi:hypothetical protein